MASNHFIDLVNNVKLVPGPNFDINFSSDIIIVAKKKTKEEAKKYYTRYIILIDRSKLN